MTMLDVAMTEMVVGGTQGAGLPAGGGVGLPTDPVDAPVCPVAPPWASM